MRIFDLNSAFSIRSMSSIFSAITFILIFISFQNCGLLAAKCPTSSAGTTTGTSSGSTTATSSSTSNCPSENGQQTSASTTTSSSSGSGHSSGGGYASSSGGYSSSSSGGYSSGGGYTSSSSGGGYGSTSSGGGYTSSSSGGNNSSSSGSGISGGPLNVNMNSYIRYEGMIVSLDLNVSGGIPPLSYQWFKGDSSISNPSIITHKSTGSTSDPFTYEDIYKVIISDGEGTQHSYTFDTRLGCATGEYLAVNGYMLNVQGAFNPFNNPSGKFLIHRNSSLLYGSRPQGAVSTNETTLSQTLNHGSQKIIGCKNNLPGIHTPTVRPNTSCGGADNPCTEEVYSDDLYYRYQGSLRFTCRNNKLQFVSKDCNWVSTGYVDPDHGL